MGETYKKAIPKQLPPAVSLDGRVPPQAIDVEAQVLGAMLLEREATVICSSLLEARHFHVDSHGKIFAAIVTLNQKGAPADIVTIAEELRKRGQLELVGGETFLAELTMKVTSAVNAGFHAKVVREKSILRDLATVSAAVARRCYSQTEDVGDLLYEAHMGVSELRAVFSGGESVKSFFQASHETSEFLQGLHDGHDRSSLIDFQFEDLDRVIGGALPGNLIILAAPEKSGKTSLALQATIRNARKGVPVLFESGEMSRIEIQSRLACIEERIRWDRVKRKELGEDEWKRLFLRIASYSQLPIYVRQGRLREEDLTSDVEIFVRKKGVRMVVVDYLQQVDTSKEHSDDFGEERLANLAYRIKDIAKQNKVPIFCLSSVNENLRTRGSTGIQYAADTIVKFRNTRPESLTQDDASYLVNFEIVQRFGLSGDINDGQVKLRYSLTDGAWYNSDDVFATPKQEELF